MIYRTAHFLAILAFFLTMSSVVSQEADPAPSDVVEDTSEVEVVPPVRITFAPPELSGRFVVGVFDAEGFLVRTLMTDEDESVFDVGLNGFITTWDGKNSDGTDAKPGRYSVRGYIVGGIEVAGVAYHFNDWVADGFTGWQVVADTILVAPDRLVALVARDSMWTLVAAPISGKAQWEIRLGEEVETAPTIQADTKWIAVANAGGLDIFSTEDGGRSGRVDGIAGNAPFAVGSGRLITASGKRLSERGLPSGAITREWDLPRNIRKVVVLKDGAAVILEGDNTEIWWTSPDASERVEFENKDTLQSLSASADGQSIWIAVTQGDKSFVREVNQAEGVLRELKIESGEPLPVRISSCENRLALLYAWDRSTRWTCLERSSTPDNATTSEPRTVDWTILADRRIVECSDFGIGKDGLVADAGDADLPDSLTVKLRPNPLDPGHADTLVVEARAENNRAWLTANNGLKLLPVSEADGWSRVALIGNGDKAEATLYQGNGWVVEEFHVSGLDQISSFDGGTFLLKGEDSSNSQQ